MYKEANETVAAHKHKRLKCSQNFCCGFFSTTFNIVHSWLLFVKLSLLVTVTL